MESSCSRPVPAAKGERVYCYPIYFPDPADTVEDTAIESREYLNRSPATVNVFRRVRYEYDRTNNTHPRFIVR